MKIDHLGVDESEAVEALEERTVLGDRSPRFSSVEAARGAHFVSVVIPAHNEERYLGKTLDSLARQTYPNFEVIVVANACSDRTEEIARGRCDCLIIMKKRALSRARNVGGLRARGDLLVFLDADTLLPPGCLEVIVREFREDDAGGTVRGRPDRDRFLYHLIYFIKNTFHRFALHRGSSGVMICWRDHFKLAGGFDEQLHLCENSDFIARLTQFGRYKYIDRTMATTSMRRYEQQGILRLALHWLKIWLLSWTSGVRNRPYDVVR